MIALKLKTNLIDKNRIFRGKKHNYLDLVLIENRNGTDEYGHDGIVKQSLSAQERADGVELPIIGNWHHVGGRAATRTAPSASPAPVVSQQHGVRMADEEYPF